MLSSPTLQFRTFPPRILHHSSAHFQRRRRRWKSNRRVESSCARLDVAILKPGRLAGASPMPNLERSLKRTLRERIYEEIVRLILAGETGERRMGGREAGDRQAAGKSYPIPRGNRDTGKGRAGRDQAISRLLRAQLFQQQDLGSLRALSGLNVLRSSSPYWI